MNANPSNRNTSSEEVDLGKFFQLIGNALSSIFRGLLAVFLYIKRNLLWLAGLLIIGVVAGYMLKLLLVQRQKLDVIVTPGLDNAEYLRDVVGQLQAAIQSEDTVFFNSLDMEVTQMKGFEIELIPLREAKYEEASENMEFLELLVEFAESEAMAEIIRSEFEDRTTLDHRITFYFKDPAIGEQYSRRLVGYINSNEFYRKLNQVYRENAQQRIRRNDSLISQIDVLIQNYTDRISRGSAGLEGRLILENEEPLDIPSILELKNTLIRDIENRRIELIKRDDAIQIVNFGKAHQVQKPLFGKWVVLLPLLLIAGFLMVSFFKYLNREASQLERES